jgi:hypothetical protein
VSSVLAEAPSTAPRVTGRSSSASVTSLLLIGWIALISADRIDVLGGHGGFQLQPYLVLTPLVFVLELMRRRATRSPIRVSRAVTWYGALALALVSLAIASVFGSPELDVSAPRVVLFTVHVLSTLVAVLLLADRGDLPDLLDRGAVVGLLVFAVFDVLQAAWLLGRVPEYVYVGPASIHLIGYTYGAFVPRLSGMVADQNRAGVVLLFFAWAVAARPHKAPRRGYLVLAAVLLLLTLSRSAILAAAVTGIVVVLERRAHRVSPASVVASLLIIGIGLSALLYSPALRDSVDVAVQPLVSRFSVDEGSSQTHVAVLQRGFDVGTESLPRVTIGLGFGSAYTVLQELFPGNRYGNFHSLYLTMFAESGTLALIALLAMIGVPLVRGGSYRPLVAGMAAFNVFYQATTDPAFWTILALAWMTMGGRRRTPDTRTCAMAPPDGKSRP